MRVVNDSAGLIQKGKGRSRGFVPTMGALHEGHLSLLKKAREDNEEVVLSIFVNPTQFGAGEDYGRYPRQLDHDLEQAESIGADVVFVPEIQTIYPEGSDAVVIRLPGISDLWEGKSRPGHFDGVATVVARLLLLVQPDMTYFGQKDLQQSTVIKTMHNALGLPGKIKILPTLRESDGLAMSSRNVYLSSEDRANAPAIYRSLQMAQSKVTSNRDQETSVILRSIIDELSSICEVDYFDFVSLPEMTKLTKYRGSSALIAAARFGTTRLIDNIIVEAQTRL